MGSSFSNAPLNIIFSDVLFVFFSGSTSLNGPGSLVHLGSLKCIHPQGGGNSVAEGTKLLIHSGCSLSRYFVHDCKIDRPLNTFGVVTSPVRTWLDMDVILTRGLASCLILPACKSGCNRRPLSRAEIDQNCSPNLTFNFTFMQESVTCLHVKIKLQLFLFYFTFFTQTGI